MVEKSKKRLVPWGRKGGRSAEKGKKPEKKRASKGEGHIPKEGRVSEKNEENLK